MNGPSNGSGRGRERPGRRALFSDPAATAGAGALETGRSGRRALFSDQAVEAGPGASGGPLTAVVHCRTCLAATPVPLTSLALALVPSLWLPTRPWPRLMRCPNCRRVSWCRIDWSRRR